jgi:hypothetical protein
VQRDPRAYEFSAGVSNLKAEGVGHASTRFHAYSSGKWRSRFNG